LRVITIDDVKATRCIRSGKTIIYDYFSEATVEIQPENVFARLRHSRPSLVLIVGVEHGSKELEYIFSRKDDDLRRG
jgi:hypothetical protein